MWDWIRGLFSALLRGFKAFMKIAIPVAKQIIVAQLRDVAINAVTELMNTDLSNEEKRNQAFERIKNYSLDKGMLVGDSMINWILETALQFIKESL